MVSKEEEKEMKRIIFLLLFLISSCSWNYYEKLNVDIIFEVTVVNSNNETIPYTNYNVESFKVKDKPMLRTFAWEIRQTNENGILRYYLNQDIRSGETIKLCVLEQCSIIDYWEAASNNKITKKLTVVDHNR